MPTMYKSPQTKCSKTCGYDPQACALRRPSRVCAGGPQRGEGLAPALRFLRRPGSPSLTSLHLCVSGCSHLSDQLPQQLPALLAGVSTASARSTTPGADRDVLPAMSKYLLSVSFKQGKSGHRCRQTNDVSVCRPFAAGPCDGPYDLAATLVFLCSPCTQMRAYLHRLLGACASLRRLHLHFHLRQKGSERVLRSFWHRWAAMSNFRSGSPTPNCIRLCTPNCITCACSHVGIRTVASQALAAAGSMNASRNVLWLVVGASRVPAESLRGTDLHRCLSARPSFWQARLCPGVIEDRAAPPPMPPCFLETATGLERVYVSAAARTTWPGDSFEEAGDFPGLAWLPEALGKDICWSAT